MLLESIKQDRENRKTKEPYRPRTLQQISLLCEGERIENYLADFEYFHNKHFLDIQNIYVRSKNNPEFAPVSLHNKKVYDLAKMIYERFPTLSLYAKSFHELRLCQQLEELNPNISSDMLKKHHYESLIDYELAKLAVPEHKKLKKKHEKEYKKLSENDELILEIFAKKKLGLDYKDRESLLEKMIGIMRHKYLQKVFGNLSFRSTEELAKEIVHDLNNDYKETSIDHLKFGQSVKIICRNGRVIKGSIQDYNSYDEELCINDHYYGFSKVFAKEDPKKTMEEYAKLFGVKTSTLKTWRKLAKVSPSIMESRINRRVEKRWQKELKKNNGKSQRVVERPTTPNGWIGLEVYIYAGGNEKNKHFDNGGYTDKVPNGSKGVVMSYKNKYGENIYLVKLQNNNFGETKKEIDYARGWRVSEREMKLSEIYNNQNILDKIMMSSYGNDIGKAMTELDLEKIMEIVRNSELNQVQKLIDYEENKISRCKGFIKAIEEGE